MKVHNHKFKGSSSGWQKSIELDDGSYVVLGMSYMASNNGAAFSSNYSSSPINVYLYVAAPMATYEERNYIVDNNDAGTARSFADADKYARQYIRENNLRKKQMNIAKEMENKA